jgi:hypothetical protein
MDKLVSFIAEDKDLRKECDEKNSLDKPSCLSMQGKCMVTNVGYYYFRTRSERSRAGDPSVMDREAGKNSARPHEGVGGRIMRGRVGSARRSTLQLGDALVLIFGLHRQAIVETLEFTRQSSERFIGDLQFGIEFLDHAVG